MSAAKVTLSPKELELVNNADWILTKNGIIQKVANLFGEVGNAFRADAEKYTDFAASPVFGMPPKVSKGEQYQSLPYIMLDYPRHFTEPDIFAIRSFFWWGNHCSIQLVLRGSFLAQYGPSIDHFFQLYGKYAEETRGWHIGVGSDPWQHHFEKSNYLPMEDWDGTSVTGLPYLKLAKKIPLEEWDDIDQFLIRHFNRLLSMMTEY